MVQLYKRKGGEVLVNTETLNTQSGATVANLPGGGFVITWSDNSLIGGDASSFAVKAQLFDANGNKTGGEFLVNTTTTGNQSGPSVAALASGRFVITWSDASATGGDTSSNAVRGQLFEANGTPVGSEFLINTVTTGSQSVPSITELAGGGFVVGWTDASGTGADNSGSGIKAQLFDAGGAKVGGEFLVNTVITGSQSSAHLIALGTGFAVAWAGAVTSSGGLTTGSVRLQLFDAAGAKVGTEQVVNASNDGNFTTANMSVLGSGFIVTWSQQDSEQAPGVPVTFDVHAQLFDANGVKVGSEFIVNTTTAGTQSAAEARLLPDGGFIVTWSGPGEGTSGTNVFGQFFDASGHKVGPEIVIAGGDGTQNGARVDVLPNGDIVVIYNDASGTGGDASATGIKMQVLTLSSDAPTDILLTTAGITEVSIENLEVATLGATNASALNSQFTYAIVSDSSHGAFRIEGDKLVIADNGKLDFETAPTVDVRIRVTDLNGASYEETLSLDIGNSATEVRYAAGDEILVTTDSHQTSGTRAITTLASGGFAVLTQWFDFGGPGGSGDGQRLQVYDADGAPVGAAHEYDLGRGGAQMVMVGLPSGGFVIAYEGNSINVPGGNSFPISAQVFDADGNKVGSEILVSSTNVGILVNPAATLLSNGNFVVGWDLLQDEMGPPNSGSQVVAQLFDADGHKLGGEFRLNTGIENSQGGVQLAALPDGGFLASWGEQQGSDYRIEAQRFDAAGAKVGGELLLVSLPIGSDSPLGAYHVTALTNGNVLFSWTELISEEPAAYLLHTRLVSPNGSVGDDLVLFGALEPSFQVAALPDGGFAVTLAVPLEPGGLNHVGAELFDSARMPIGYSFEVPENGREGSDPLITVLASGDVAIAYTGAAEDGQSLSDTYARIFSLEPAPTGPTDGPDILNGTDNADTIDGLGGNDVINGLGGDDVLIGGSGTDAMTGGTGNDWYFVDNAGDVVVELTGEGNDRVFASASYALGAGQSVELLTTDFNGGTAAINLTGNELANTIIGNAGANVLDGGAGADTLVGFGGDDFFMIDNAADAVVENAGQGNDRVFASVSYTLAAGQSVELLTTDFNGGTAAINLTGNELANTIFGNDGANILDGGAGADVLIGRAGNDFYFVDNAGDVVVENAGEGSDRVFASTSYTLAAGASVELLTTDFNPGTAAINLTGNELANTIIGNDGANILNGGAGADVLVGRAGDDFFMIDNAGDVVVENAGEGNDRLFASVSYILAAGVSVELLTTDFNAGTAAINLTGNELANTIFGNAGTNILDGGAGADVLVGFAGNDFYYVDNAADVVIENAGEGSDRVFASTSYTLAAGASVELLTTDFNGGTSAINLTGNELANTIFGNDGNNILDGKSGADTLVGFGGDDVYKVDNASDLVLESAGQGNDQIIATVSYALASGSSIETLFAATGTAAINLTGNELANNLTGNDGNNVLCGGLGQDILYGGSGADSFLFNVRLGLADADGLTDFASGIDKILLDHNIFTGLPLGELSLSAFSYGSNVDANTRIIYSNEFLYFDADGSGPGQAVIFATTAGLVPVNASDFVVI